MFDVQGNKISETDKNGNVHTWEYDAYGLVTKEQETDGLLHTNHYDAWHLVIKTENNSGRKTEYRYEEKTGKIEREIQWLSETQAVETRYGYDRFGRMTEVTDAIGNVLKLVTPNAHKDGGAGEAAFRYRYDYLDRQIESKDPYGTIHRTFVDMDGNVIKEVHPEARPSGKRNTDRQDKRDRKNHDLHLR
ncbi:MAG: hypothetical protein II838_13765 [Lachnospiraceae bacterium]|nr:hypothetical protein [Lachnospiraceae bacterium]